MVKTAAKQALNKPSADTLIALADACHRAARADEGPASILLSIAYLCRTIGDDMSDRVVTTEEFENTFQQIRPLLTHVAEQSSVGESVSEIESIISQICKPLL